MSRRLITQHQLMALYFRGKIIGRGLRGCHLKCRRPKRIGVINMAEHKTSFLGRLILIFYRNSRSEHLSTMQFWLFFERIANILSMVGGWLLK